MAERGRWVYPLSPTALRKRLFGDTWSLCWNRSFMQTPMAIDRGARRSMVSVRPVSDAGGTTGFSIWTSRHSSTASIGDFCCAGAEAHAVPVGVAVHRTLAESACDVGGRDTCSAGSGNAARGCD